MKSRLLYHYKVHVFHSVSDVVAVAEIKVWNIPKSSDFPEGIKYSLFLVNIISKNVLIGFDNHKPKGHHKHYHESEEIYLFKDVGNLLEDFWTMVKVEGFLI